MYLEILALILAIFVYLNSDSFCTRFRNVARAMNGEITVSVKNVTVSKEAVTSDNVVDLEEGVQRNLSDLSGKTFIIAGKSRIGKSSLINVITGAKVAETSSGVKGLTFKFSPYRINGTKFFDTVGLSEEKDGSFDNKTALKELMVLVNSLKTGVHGLIMVHNGVPDKLFRDNITLIHSELLESKVPMIIFINKADEGKNIDEFNFQTRTQFKTINLGQVDVIGGCTSMSENKETFLLHKTLRTQTRKKIIASLKMHSLEDPFIFTNPENTFIKVMNWFGKFLGWETMVYDKLGDLLRRVGFNKEDEKEVRDRINEGSLIYTAVP